MSRFPGMVRFSLVSTLERPRVPCRAGVAIFAAFMGWPLCDLDAAPGSQRSALGGDRAALRGLRRTAGRTARKRGLRLLLVRRQVHHPTHLRDVRRPAPDMAHGQPRRGTLCPLPAAAWRGELDAGRGRVRGGARSNHPRVEVRLQAFARRSARHPAAPHRCGPARRHRRGRARAAAPAPAR